MVLLKYFAKESKEDWSREVDIAKSLSFCDQPHASLVRYRWHSKGEKAEKKNRSFLFICHRSQFIILDVSCFVNSPKKVPCNSFILRLQWTNFDTNSYLAQG